MRPKELRYWCSCVCLILLLFGLALSSDIENVTEEGIKLHVPVEISERYGFEVSHSVAELFSYPLDIETCMNNQTCYDGDDCSKCFPNIDDAFRPGLPTDVASRPICKNNTITGEGQCMCGIDLCISYSRDSQTEKPFYYCGPCGYIGSSCENGYCSHYLAECREGFCECGDTGTFYDMYLCYYPYFGMKMLIQMFVSTIIIVALCGVLAYSYHRLNRTRRSYSRRYGSFRRNSEVRESPEDDTPPTYDDVVEKVPSYDDALAMENANNAEKGLSNPAFEDDELPPPPSYEDIQNVQENPTTHGIGAAAASEQPMGIDNATIQEGNTFSADQSQISKDGSKSAELQPIELPLQNALDEYRPHDPTDDRV